MALNINGTTGISGVDGSVSAPALTGTDSNTGITFPSADTIKFSTGGVERMAITNSGVTGITAGITMADQWRISSSFTFATGYTDITSNWERVDTDGFGQLGTGMTESSGIFSFPSTGIYLITFFGNVQRNSGNDRFGEINLYTTVNNSSYSEAASSYACAPSQYNRGAIALNFIFDVTNISTHKLKFRQYENHGSLNFLGSSDINLNSTTFIRLGDT